MIILGIGSNEGDRLGFIRQAVESLRALPALTLRAVSPVYESDALVTEDAPAAWHKPYLNIAVYGETTASAQELLAQCKAIETALGRRPGKRFSPRVIDIDILAYGNHVICEPQLCVPHASLIERPFALWPLADVAPTWCYPVRGEFYAKTARELAQRWGACDGDIPLKTRQISASIQETQYIGIINVTPDSFSDGGLHVAPEACVQRAQMWLDRGIKIIDVGAESTRPGAKLLDPRSEWQRLEPVLRALHPLAIPCLSLDTRHVEVAKRASAFGLRMLNDVSGLVDPHLRQLAIDHDWDVVLMHNMGVPADKNCTIALNEDPVTVVYDWAQRRIAELLAQGMKKQHIIFDIGVGFGKTAQQSLILLKNIDFFHRLGVRLYVGHSRKSFLNALLTIGEVADQDRDLATGLITGYLTSKEVHYVRVHDVVINQRMSQLYKALRMNFFD